jgi:hypothetical protein
LENNLYYPSYAVFIDLNDDGRCDLGDFGVSSQRYGWDAAIDESVGIDFAPVDDMQAAIGSTAKSFCASYFPVAE